MPLSDLKLADVFILIFYHFQIFERLKKGVDPKLQEEKTKLANERELAQFPEGSAAVGGAGDSSSSFSPMLKRAIGGMVEFILTSCADSRQLYTTYYHILNTHPQCNEHTERLS